MRIPFNENYRLTQKFGENPASYAKFGLKGHNGLDYGTPTGTNILAPHSGRVLEASSDPTGYGLYIKIENDKEGSVLAHLKEFKVKVGDQVTEGQLIALSDNTGNSIGPHLHWGYYAKPRNRQNGYAGFIDQLPLIIAVLTLILPTNGGATMDQQKGSGKFDQVVRLLNQNKLIDYDNPQRYYDNDDVLNAIKRLIERQGDPEDKNKLAKAKDLGRQITEL